MRRIVQKTVPEEILMHDAFFEHENNRNKIIFYHPSNGINGIPAILVKTESGDPESRWGFCYLPDLMRGKTSGKKFPSNTKEGSFDKAIKAGRIVYLSDSLEDFFHLLGNLETFE